MTAPARQRFTFDGYLLVEDDSVVKHEFLAGEVWAMAGGSPEHAAIIVNVSASLHGQLRGKPCRVYGSDLRVRVQATGLATYPDVTIICGSPELDPEDRKRQTVTNPTLIVEVLSPSTEDYDRGEKLEQYQRIESLCEVVLVAHDKRSVTVWRRTKETEWASDEYAGEGVVKLTSVPCELSLSDVYTV
jgi:Uma2 family endonuclease